MFFGYVVTFKVKINVIFRNKRSQAKGFYYVFLDKQHLDNVYTRVSIHNLTRWLTDAEPIVSPRPCSPARFSLYLSLSPLDW